MASWMLSLRAYYVGVHARNLWLLTSCSMMLRAFHWDKRFIHQTLSPFLRGRGWPARLISSSHRMWQRTVCSRVSFRDFIRGVSNVIFSELRGARTIPGFIRSFHQRLKVGAYSPRKISKYVASEAFLVASEKDKILLDKEFKLEIFKGEGGCNEWGRYPLVQNKSLHVLWCLLVVDIRLT